MGCTARSGIDQLTAAGLKVIRYDGRGTGSSDRDLNGILIRSRDT